MYENGKLMEINISSILPNRFQPRFHFDDSKLGELAESIRKYGVIQPVVVRPVNGKYEIIAGERRYKASKIANRTSIPAIVVNINDKDAEEIALLENIQRQELSPIEEAVSYKRILDAGYISSDELAKKIGKSTNNIAKKISLLSLDDKVQDALLHGKISERHARSLLRIKNKTEQVKMLDRIINERLTVKMLDKEIKNTFGDSKFEIRKIVLDSKKDERGNDKMDIDRIMNEAQDINQPVSTNDISSLMKPDSVIAQPAEQTPTAPMQLPGQETAPANRFVNINTGNAAVSSESVSGVNTPNTFASVFGQSPVNVSNDVQAAITPEPSLAQVPETQVVSETNLNQVTALPNVAIENVVQSQIATPMPEAPSMPAPAPMSEAPTVSSTMPEVSVVSSVVENSFQQDLPVSNGSAFHDLGSNIPSDDIIGSDFLQPVMEQGNTMNQVSSPTPEVLDSPMSAVHDNSFVKVIDLIRECASKVEELGYFIDVDELDLGENYQVTFKIDKDL